MKKVLIANRGEIACRIIKTCREMGLATVAVASEPDRNAPHAREADEYRVIGPGPVTDSYLQAGKIIEVALETGADAIHPGFGFLSENAAFARAVSDAGLVFIGPAAEVIQAMGSKMESKRLMAAAGVPVVPGYHGEEQDADSLAKRAEEIGFPVLIKASAGGGGKGMRAVYEPGRFREELGAAKREARAAFGDDSVLLEKYLERPRHIEFQVFGDQRGNLVHLYERECSIQRRHQKILEETPSTALDGPLRARMAEAALAAAGAVNYSNAGTVEFMLDTDGSFYFLEMNTRLQVEHPVTEMLTGLDLVRWQIMVARGEPLPMKQSQITARGHALEVRVYAEDPQHGFLPQTGRLIRYQEPEGLGVRVDSGVAEGDEVSIFYDPMLAKLITWAMTREDAIHKMEHALMAYCIHGVKTNLSFLKAIVTEAHFQRGETYTDYLKNHMPASEPSRELVETALALTAAAGAAPGSEPMAVSRSQDPWDCLNGWRMRA